MNTVTLLISFIYIERRNERKANRTTDRDLGGRKSRPTAHTSQISTSASTLGGDGRTPWTSCIAHR